VTPSPHTDPAAKDLLLVNPAAGGGLARQVLPKLREFLGQSRWKVEICVSQNSEDLARLARRGAQEGKERILVLGGDGTFQVLLNALVDYPEIILGVIPAGGGNDLAAGLGLPADPILAAGLLLEGEVCRLDVARVRTAEGRERLYSGGGGVGLDAEAARYTSGAYRNLRGRLRYLLAAIRALISFHAIRARIEITGRESQTLEATVLLAGVLNTQSYGAGLRLAPEAEMDDGKLDLVLLEDLGLVEILRLLPTLASNGELRTKRVHRYRVERVRIETDRPCWFHGDGELLGVTPVEISVIPRGIRVLRPRSRGGR